MTVKESFCYPKAASSMS